MPRAAHGKAVRCTLPGKCLLMQARQPLAGLIAQKNKAAVPATAALYQVLFIFFPSLLLLQILSPSPLTASVTTEIPLRCTGRKR